MVPPGTEIVQGHDERLLTQTLNQLRSIYMQGTKLSLWEVGKKNNISISEE